MNAFRLPHLPWVALQEVLNEMTPVELIAFSKINLKTKTMIKSFLKPNSRKYYFRLSMQQPNPKVRIGAHEMKFIRENEEDVLDEIKKETEYILDLFGIGIHCLSIDVDAFPARDIIHWVAYVSESIEYFGVNGESSDDEMVHYILNKLKITEGLELRVKISDNFQSGIPNFAHELVIIDGNWINLQQLLLVNSRRIAILNIKLSSSELNILISLWVMSAVHRNLQYLEILIENFDLETVFQGISYQLVDTETIRSFYGFEMEQVYGGIDVRRISDGATATFYATQIDDREYLTMAVN